jgi:hypothetical protein
MQAEQNLAVLGISSTTERVLAAAGVLAMAGGSAAVAFVNPSTSNFFPICPLFALTGLACPGCGLTRGFHSLFHGDIISAIDFNALIPVWAAVFGWVFVSLLLLAVRGKGLPMWPTNPKVLWVFTILLMTFGVLRNLPIYPFTILYP